MIVRGLPMAALCVMLAAVGFDATAQSAQLDAPMHPIDKATDAPPRCIKCPPPGVSEAALPHVTDRSAPEYPGAHRESIQMQPTEALTGDLVGTAAALPLPLPAR